MPWRNWGLRGLACGLALAGSFSIACAEDHAAHEHGGAEHAMPGVLGTYSMSREASGTSWQPDTTPHHGRHWTLGEWTVGAHAMLQGVFDHQAGELGDDEVFSNSMLMAMGNRPLGPGRLGLRTMLSFEAATNGKEGYPLLLQTGETADGRTPLVDRQHPHDLFMELAGTYGLPLSDETSLFAYFGLPGEPSLGPPAFMHRFSGMESPEAPISHHWLDSTHITFGVATVGAVWRDWKIEGSVFTGREPDQDRYDIEEPKFDSYSGRISWNPLPEWSLQASGGHLEKPEQLHPFSNTDRFTVSIAYGTPFGDGDYWQTIFAWGLNVNRSSGTPTDPLLSRPNHELDAFLLESAATLDHRHTFFGRAESVQVDELFAQTNPLHGFKFNTGKVSLGYVIDLVRADLATVGLGAMGSVLILPNSLLRDAYGSAPASGMFFVRVKAG